MAELPQRQHVAPTPRAPQRSQCAPLFSLAHVPRSTSWHPSSFPATIAGLRLSKTVKRHGLHAPNVSLRGRRGVAHAQPVMWRLGRGVGNLGWRWRQQRACRLVLAVSEVLRFKMHERLAAIGKPHEYGVAVLRSLSLMHRCEMASLEAHGHGSFHLRPVCGVDLRGTTVPITAFEAA